jgi:hypothetical protein
MDQHQGLKRSTLSIDSSFVINVATCSVVLDYALQPLHQSPAGLPVSDWMSSWTLAPHYPVLSVDLVTSLPGKVSLSGSDTSSQQQGGEGGAVLQLTQQPFMPGQVQCGTYQGSFASNSSSTNVTSGQWWIPVDWSLPVSDDAGPPQRFFYLPRVFRPC